jgi:GNAT superfamily N-acetyltransferase
VIDIVDVTAIETHALRSRVLDWIQPRSRLDGDGASHLAVTDDGVVVAVVSHTSWPYPRNPTAPARYFWAMAVDPLRQRHGYGRQLLTTVSDIARAAGEILMWADARESAVPFYVACGAQLDEASPYVDEITGLLDRRIVFALVDRHLPSGKQT